MKGIPILGNVILAMVATTLVILSSVNQANADVFLSYPGTRSRAMGGAATGVANDAGACWYNPAGMTGEGTDLIAEWSQALSIKDSDGSLDNDENAFFFGGKFSGEDSVWGVGVFWYTPYTMKYFLNRQAPGEVSGLLVETIHIIGLVPAFSLFDDMIKIGGSLEWVHLNVSESRSELYYTNYSGETWRIAWDKESGEENANGFSGSLGLLFTPLDYKPWGLSMSFGGVYRFESTASFSGGDDEGADFDDTPEADALKDVLFTKPSSWEAGFSLSKTFTKAYSALLFSAQYGITDWTKGSEIFEIEYEKLSFGIEWVFSKELVFINAIALRGGYYESNLTDAVEGWPDVTGISFGIGLLLGESFGVESTYEIREVEFKDEIYSGYNDDIGLVSVALTYAFY